MLGLRTAMTLVFLTIAYIFSIGVWARPLVRNETVDLERLLEFSKQTQPSRLQHSAIMPVVLVVLSRAGRLGRGRTAWRRRRWRHGNRLRVHRRADPYLWLEEIDSARALNWVRAKNAATDAEAGVAADLPGAAARRAGRARLPVAPAGRGADGRVDLQLLEGRPAPARHLPACHAGRAPEARTRLGKRCWTSTSLAQRARTRPGSSTAWIACRRSTGSACCRSRRAAVTPRGARVRSGDTGLRARWLLGAGRQDRDRLAGCGQRLPRHGLRAGVDDEVGLSAPGPVVDARHAARPRDDPVSRRSRNRWARPASACAPTAATWTWSPTIARSMRPTITSCWLTAACTGWSCRRPRRSTTCTRDGWSSR